MRAADNLPLWTVMPTPGWWRG